MDNAGLTPQMRDIADSGLFWHPSSMPGMGFITMVIVYLRQ
jgi:hypothetical protein